MKVAQSMMLLGVIISNPGFTIEEIAARLVKVYGDDNDRVAFMSLERTDEKSQIVSLIKDIYCVEKKGNQYFFNEALPMKKEEDFLDLYIAQALLENAKKIKKINKKNKKKL